MVNLSSSFKVIAHLARVSKPTVSRVFYYGYDQALEQRIMSAENEKRYEICPDTAVPQ